MRVQNLARSSGLLADHSGKAARAALAAASTSAALPSGMRPNTSPLVESNTSIVPDPCGRHPRAVDVDLVVLLHWHGPLWWIGPPARPRR